MDFYNRFIELCNKKNVKPSPMLESIGIRKSANSNWKKRKSNPTSANLQKIADYFGVTVEYLKGETENPTGDRFGGDMEKKFTVYSMEGTPTEEIKVNIENLNLISDLVKIVQTLPKEKIEALIITAKAMK